MQQQIYNRALQKERNKVGTSIWLKHCGLRTAFIQTNLIKCQWTEKELWNKKKLTKILPQSCEALRSYISYSFYSAEKGGSAAFKLWSAQCFPLICILVQILSNTVKTCCSVKYCFVYLRVFSFYFFLRSCKERINFIARLQERWTII